MSNGNTGAFGCATLIIAVVAFAGIGIAKNAHRVEHNACVVEDKDRAGSSDGGSDMRVYTSCGVFAVKDSLWLARWDSADVYRSIEVGETYTLETAGWRFGLFSWFPNIVQAEVSDA